MDADATLKGAGQIISGYFGGRIHLRSGEIYQSAKSLVTRYYVTDNAANAPASFIVKHTLASPLSSSQAEFNLLTDWASCLFLRTIPGPYVWAPLCYGGDLTRRIIVLEDLGTGAGSNTTELLMGDDPQAAEQGLMEHVRLLGSLHASTTGTANTYRSVRQALGAEPKEDPLFAEPWSNARRRPLPPEEIDQAVRRYSDVLKLMGIVPRQSLKEEIADVANSVESDPGPYLAYCRGDQNMAGDYLRCGDQLRLFDFDSGGFRHALLEGMPGRMTWGCMLRIPTQIVSQMEKEYHNVWAAHRPEIATSANFGRTMTGAGARWHIFHVIARVAPALERDRLRGCSSLRQQCVAWINAFVSLSEEFPSYPALGTAACALSEKLSVAWAEVDALPYFPAFRNHFDT